MSEDDTRIGRGAAIATVVLAIVGLVGTAVFMVTGLVMNIIADPDPVTDDPSARVWERYKGIFPLEMPWWVYLLPALGWIIVLVAVWKPKRSFMGMSRKGGLVMFASPGFTAGFATLTAIAALTTGLYMPEPRYGLFWIPAAVLGATAVVAGVRARVLSRRRSAALQAELAKRREASARAKLRRQERAYRDE